MSGLSGFHERGAGTYSISSDLWMGHSWSLALRNVYMCHSITREIYLHSTCVVTIMGSLLSYNRLVFHYSVWLISSEASRKWTPVLCQTQARHTHLSSHTAQSYHYIPLHSFFFYCTDSPKVCHQKKQMSFLHPQLWPSWPVTITLRCPNT